MNLSLGGRIAAALGLALLILSAIAVVSYRGMIAVADATQKTTRIRHILERFDELAPQLEEGKSAESYYATIQKLAQQVTELQQMAAGDLVPIPGLEALASLVASEAAAANEWAKLPKTETASRATEQFSARLRRQLTGKVQEVIRTAKDWEEDRRRQWSEAAAATARNTIPVIAYGTALGFLLVFLVGFFLTRSLGSSVRRLAKATERIGIDNLEYRVAVKPPKGEMSRLAAAVSGMAERHQQTQRTLRDQVQTLESILQNLSDGVIVADQNGETLFVNPAALQLLGVRATGGRLEKSWERNTFYLPDAVTPYPMNRLPLASALRGETTNGTEVVVRPPDAPEGRWLSVAAQPLAGVDGVSRRGVIVFTDITEFRRAEAALRDSERLLRAILETLPVGVWVAEPDGNITMANPASKEIWGGAKYVGVDQYEEFHAWEVETHERLEAHQWPLARAVATGQASLGEVLDIESFDGSRKTIRHSAVPVRDSNRQLIGFVAVTEDITEARWRETQIKELMQQMAQRARDLEAVNKELEAFCWSVSHDLRAPLRGIEGFSRALLEDYADRLDEEGRDYLQRVCAATLRMARLIDDLLNLSRVTRSEIRRTAVDLTDLAEGIATELRKSEPDRQVEFSITPGLTVNADASLLRVAMENLLGNAWKFTGKQSHARIEVGVTEAQGERRYHVRDNGAGFDMAYAGKLFGAFQRLHGPTEFEGTGIGLATVQRIVHRHGGRVGAEGAVGEGATFYFTLP